MEIEKVDHVAIRVKDLKKAIQLFGTLFELDFRYVGESEELDIRSAIEEKGVELVEPLTPDGIMAKLIQNHGEGLTLLSLKVKSLEKAIQEMKENGIRLLNQMQNGDAKIATFHPQDTCGVMIELIEYRNEHPCLTAIKGYKASPEL